MKLYHLTMRYDLQEGDNPWEPWYDKTAGFVIRANSEDEARQIAHANAGDENRGEFSNRVIACTNQPWLEPKYSTCQELSSEGPTELILRDFMAA